MLSWISQILPPVWSTLTSSADKYLKEVSLKKNYVKSHNFELFHAFSRFFQVVNESGAEDDIVDSDGEVLGFENLVFAIFEFVHALVETPKFRVALKSGLADIMYYIVLYMQITHEQVTSNSISEFQFRNSVSEFRYSDFPSFGFPSFGIPSFGIPSFGFQVSVSEFRFLSFGVRVSNYEFFLV